MSHRDAVVVEDGAMSPTWIHLFLDTPAERWESGVAFWSEVTGCRVSPGRGERGQFVTVLPERGRSWLKIQAVEGDKAGVHLDLDAPERLAAVARRRALGARDAWTYERAAVMHSPGGLPYCHTLGDDPEAAGMEREGRVVIADQVCLDIPARLWDAEVDFWCRLTGRELERGLRSEFAFLGDPDPAGPPRVLLQRLDDDAPRVTAHLDLAVADRTSEVRRHEGLGAQRLADFERWTVLRAPSGHEYCLTDRSPATGMVRRPG